MHRVSSVVVFVAAALVAVWSQTIETQTTQSSQGQRGQGGGRGRGQSSGPQGWPGTPPTAEPPVVPKAPAGVKEGDVWIPPLPSMESVAPPAGWVTAGP